MHEDSGIKKIAHCLLPGYRPPKVRFITLTFGGRYQKLLLIFFILYKATIAAPHVGNNGTHAAKPALKKQVATF